MSLFVAGILNIDYDCRNIMCAIFAFPLFSFVVSFSSVFLFLIFF